MVSLSFYCIISTVSRVMSLKTDSVNPDRHNNVSAGVDDLILKIIT